MSAKKTFRKKKLGFQELQDFLDPLVSRTLLFLSVFAQNWSPKSSVARKLLEVAEGKLISKTLAAVGGN